MKPYRESERIAIYNADCMSILPEIETQSIGVIITDPPYSKPTNQFRPSARIAQRSFGEFSTFQFFFAEYIKQCVRVLKSEGDLFLFCDETFYPVLFPSLYQNFYATKLLVWDKQRIGMGGIWRRQFELVVHAYLLPKKQRSGDSDIIRCKPVPSKERLHFSQKPEMLIEKLLSKTNGGIILDTFLGSGTTLVVANKMDYESIGIEIDEHLCKAAVLRIFS